MGFLWFKSKEQRLAKLREEENYLRQRIKLMTDEIDRGLKGEAKSHNQRLRIEHEGELYRIEKKIRKLES